MAKPVTMLNRLEVKTREELRNWLTANSKTASECWVTVSVKPQPDKVLYLDAVEEALCFGWIDSVKKKLDETRTVQRLSPRSRKSSWTELNKARVRRLEELGLMTDEGRRVLPAMARDLFHIDPEIEERLKADRLVYAHFIAFPELYRRIRIDTIQSCRNQPLLYESRLTKFIHQTRDNIMFGQWNDGGRLLSD